MLITATLSLTLSGAALAGSHRLGAFDKIVSAPAGTEGVHLAKASGRLHVVLTVRGKQTRHSFKIDRDVIEPSVDGKPGLRVIAFNKPSRLRASSLRNDDLGAVTQGEVWITADGRIDLENIVVTKEGSTGQQLLTKQFLPVLEAAKLRRQARNRGD